MTARWLGRLAALGLLGVLLAPLAYVVWMSFAPGELLAPPTHDWSLRWYEEFCRDPRWTDALWNSLVVAVLSTLGALAAGTGVAVAVARLHFHGRRGLAGLVLLPLFLPAVVLAAGQLPLAHLLGIHGTMLPLVLAHCLNSLPLVFLLVRAALDETNPDLEWAARGLGAGPVRAFWRVTWPLLRPAVLTGAALSFILSLNELTLALFLTTAETETLPVVLWPKLRYTLSPLVAAASCVTMSLTLVGLALGAGFKRLDRLFRRFR